jgi:hypothetical protein
MVVNPVEASFALASDFFFASDSNKKVSGKMNPIRKRISLKERVYN